VVCQIELEPWLRRKQTEGVTTTTSSTSCPSVLSEQVPGEGELKVRTHAQEEELKLPAPAFDTAGFLNGCPRDSFLAARMTLAMTRILAIAHETAFVIDMTPVMKSCNFRFSFSTPIHQRSCQTEQIIAPQMPCGKRIARVLLLLIPNGQICTQAECHRIRLISGHVSARKKWRRNSALFF